ncbi:MAG: hypothetical protein DLM67_22955 [Candidatus Nephthysia bennettiae]|uniref:Tyrosine-type recombinase/integrase n=1 Tax=Candidatus Nephthysia bennettiae TaxID=3127016 RepID=A0A934K233_9BACT|nr:tyrosine-type recombinase/integrase [Candidatus Dormibacteraeota bacterium]PZR86998.1 MAG: hypothetical protein DLM67_22955 [Candidatus Dormibacteraeota bacterium]
MQLIRAPSNRAPTGIRNRALLVVMYRGGLRIGEALAVKPAAVDSRAGTVRVMHGKGDSSRVVGRSWLDGGARAVDGETRAAGHPNTGAVLHAGRFAARPFVRTEAPGAAGREGRHRKRVNPHALRHSHAAELAAEGVPGT